MSTPTTVTPHATATAPAAAAELDAAAREAPTVVPMEPARRAREQAANLDAALDAWLRRATAANGFGGPEAA